MDKGIQRAIKEIPLRNESVIFACRKSPISLASLLGESVTFFYFIVAMSLYLEDYGFLPMLTLSIFPSLSGIYGFLIWRSEIHIVSEFRDKSGGVYRKISGPFSLRIRETSVTSATPDLTRDIPFVLRVWEWLTGQGISKVTLRSDGQMIIPSGLMPTRLYKAIAELKGEPARRVRRESTRIHDIARAIQSSYYDGILRRDKATALMESLLDDEVL